MGSIPSVEEGRNGGQAGERNATVSVVGSGSDTRESSATLETGPGGAGADGEADTVFGVARIAQKVSDGVLVLGGGSIGGAERPAREASGTARKTASKEACDRDCLVTAGGDGQHASCGVSPLVVARRGTGGDRAVGSRSLGGRTSEVSLHRGGGPLVANAALNLRQCIGTGQQLSADAQRGTRSYRRGPCPSHAVAETGLRTRVDLADTSDENPVSGGATPLTNVLEHTVSKRPFPILRFAVAAGMQFVQLHVGRQ
jgi:hypothetical protein